MTRPHLAKLATDLLASEAETRAPTSEAEMRAVVAIEAALARRRRSRRAGRLAIASTLAVAAAIAFVVGTRASHRPSPAALAPVAPAVPSAVLAPPIVATALAPAGGALVLRDGQTQPLAPAMTLSSGDGITTPSTGPAGVGLDDGSRLRIEAASEISVRSLSTTRRFLLRHGSLHADVAKLGPEQRFVVETADAEVEVHGTSFRVSIREGTTACPPLTRVEVMEGVVSVRHLGREARLERGSTWPPCDAPAPVPIMPADVPRAPRAPGVPSARPTPSGSAAASSPALARQNELFAKATAARHAGDGPAAVAAYDRLIADYPDGFLAEGAAVERMRVLDGMDHRRGREAATSYLARYPNGFARAEAQRIAQ